MSDGKPLPEFYPNRPPDKKLKFFYHTMILCVNSGFIAVIQYNESRGMKNLPVPQPDLLTFHFVFQQQHLSYMFH